MTPPSDGRLQQIKDGCEVAAAVAAGPLLRRLPPPATTSVVYDPHPTLCLPTVAALYTALDSVNLSLCHVVLRQTERATATCGYWLGTLK